MATGTVQVDIVIENEKAIAAFCKGLDCVRRAAESGLCPKDMTEALEWFELAINGLVPKARNQLSDRGYYCGRSRL